MKKVWRVFFAALVAAVALLAVPRVAQAQAQAPSNDVITSATVVTGVPFTNSVNTNEATYDKSDRPCGWATVWYQFTPTETGFIEFNTAGSDYDTTLALYTGTARSPSLVSCNDDTTQYGLQSRIVAELSAGTTYYISAGTCCGEPPPGQVGPGGNLVFNVQTGSPPGTLVTTTVERQNTVTQDGVVTVTGTLTCAQQSSASISFNLKQRFARNVAEGFGSTETECGPAPTPWSVTLSSYTGTLFGAGNATMNVFVIAFNGSDGSSTSLSEQIHLRRSR